MKRVSYLLLTLALCAAPGVRAQDAATQERLDKLSGRIEDLTAAQEALRNQIMDLSKELESLREQSGKPSTTYARQEDLEKGLKQLADAIKEVDRKRLDDAENVRAELVKLRKVLEAPPPPSRKSATSAPKDLPAAAASTTPEKGFEHVVKSGETLDGIVLACRERNIKVTVSQVLKANPGLKAERMKVGQKIFIPAPQP
jgi:LysM repeat protein